ncbi:MAG TPA: HAD hydrolase family protein [Chloroflexota bacterium]|nr:HAD hydrolase family protein [Chloroflexota bacterium]
MLKIDIPGRGTYQFERLVIAVNGTIAEDGELIAGVRERFVRLGRALQVMMVTADRYGRQVAIDRELELEAVRLELREAEAPQKAELVRRLGSDGTIAIGNGANDALMLKEAAIGIAVVGPEGASAAAVQSADVVTRSVLDALDLLIFPRRLVATLRQ